MRLAFTLEYDGTNFSGFQRQTNAITIQEQIENAIKKVEGSDISINYSGRTDAGVHALSQVFDFETNILRDHKNWINGINSNLPKTISVKKVFEVPIDFNSRFSAKERKYSYVIYNSKNKPLFFDRFSKKLFPVKSSTLSKKILTPISSSISKGPLAQLKPSLIASSMSLNSFVILGTKEEAYLIILDRTDQA